MTIMKIKLTKTKNRILMIKFTVFIFHNNKMCESAVLYLYIYIYKTVEWHDIIILIMHTKFYIN